MKIGYARVSITDQCLDQQLDALKAAGCDRFFKDVISGSTTSRPEFDRMQDQIRGGDTVVVWKLDRVGRSIKHLIEVVEGWRDAGVQFVSLTEGFDTTTPAGEMLFHVIGAMAQFERSLIRERTKVGLAAARARGRKGGGQFKLTKAQIEQGKKMWAGGMTANEIGLVLGVSRSTLYRAGVCTPLAKEGC
jgi:DNA invertase Pin-like site-specific DNA recombinase